MTAEQYLCVFSHLELQARCTLIKSSCLTCDVFVTNSVTSHLRVSSCRANAMRFQIADYLHMSVGIGTICTPVRYNGYRELLGHGALPSARCVGCPIRTTVRAANAVRSEVAKHLHMATGRCETRCGSAAADAIFSKVCNHTSSWPFPAAQVSSLI